jgi:predicted O-methyltransferase YrrM
MHKESVIVTLEQWTTVDAYFSDALTPEDTALMAALERSEAAGLPAMSVAPNQGQLLRLLAMSIGARSILEVGTLGGYSTIWLARALPSEGEGRVVSLELNPDYATVARENLARAGLDGRVEVRVGPAVESLGQLVTEGGAPFDLIFIDADKENNVAYFEGALALSRPGSLIIVDNVVRDGAVIDADSADPRVQGVRRLIARMSAEPRVACTALQTVGSKGYDGFAMALVIR